MIDPAAFIVPEPHVITFSDDEGRRLILHKDGLVIREGFQSDQQAMAAVYEILSRRTRVGGEG